MSEVVVRARVRRRTAHDEPVSAEHWETASAPAYEAARDAIRQRLPDEEFVVAWYVDR